MLPQDPNFRTTRRRPKSLPSIFVISPPAWGLIFALENGNSANENNGNKSVTPLRSTLDVYKFFTLTSDHTWA